MPYRRRFRGRRRFGRRSRFRRRSRFARRRSRFSRRISRPSYGPRQILNVGRSFVPERARVRMRYCHRLDFKLNSFNTHYQQATFRADNIFDPYRTGAGHQPYGFDQWATLYKYYTVLSSRISVLLQYTDTDYENNSDAAPAMYLGIACIEESQRSNYHDLPLSAKQEHPLTVWKKLGGPVSGMNKAVLRCHYNAYRRTGSNPWTDTTQEKLMNGGTGANLNQFYFYIFVTNDVGGFVETDRLTMQVTIDYNVLLRESIMPNQSLLNAAELANEQPGSPLMTPPVSPGVDDGPGGPPE